MGLFSFFSRKKELEVSTVSQYSDYFTRDMIWEAISSSGLMTLFFTKKDGWIGANRYFCDSVGLEGIEDFRTKYESIREVFSSESEEVFTEDDKSWLDYLKKYKKYGYEVTIKNRDDETVYIKAKCHNLLHTPEIYVLELEDITELHYAELKTKEVEKLKSRFLSNIGHEFRTPMNGILGFIELLEQTNVDEQQKEYLNMIHRSSKNLMVNIETLLDLSQMQGNRLTVENAPFSLLEYMENITLGYTFSGREKGIKVLTFIDPKLPQEINSDAKKIMQIMNALIQNAIKFTPRGGRVIIEVKLLKRRQNGDCSISFSVKDNGKGIPEEQIALISEPFTAGNHADERLGVGLSLSNGLVKLLDSKLSIHSEIGEGSHFSFVLDFKNAKGQSYKMMPKKRVKVLLLDRTRVDEANFLTIYLRSFAIDVVKANILDENVYDGVEALYIIGDQNDSSWMLKLGTFTKKSSITMFLRGDEKLQTKLTHLVDEVVQEPLLPSVMAKHLHKLYNIESYSKTVQQSQLSLKESISALVVEDNLINQRLIQILLKEYNIVVSTASNGNEAVQKCKKGRFDIVFMDIDMPEKNGIVATKEIKKSVSLNKTTPIVALTAMAMEGDKEMLLKEGLDDYLSKPLTREKLEHILDKYLKVTAL